MTEKRFKYVEFTRNILSFDDNGVCKFFNEQDFEDWLNEQHEDYDKLFKFVVVMNRQINNSIVISDQFKEVWNHVLKKVVGDVE